MSKKNTPENEAPVKTEEAAKKPSAKKIKDNISEELATISAELNSAKDNMMRLAAEYDNFRKRSQKEKESLSGDTKAAVIKELLPVIDNFERALGSNTEDIEVYKKGIEMTFRQLSDILTKLGVEPFGEKGEPFDPELHNAVMLSEDETLPESSVGTVFSKGYRMGDRILRCADVQAVNQ